MRRLASFAFALILSQASSLAQQQPARDRADVVTPSLPTGTASITGRVTIAVDGKLVPVRRARVTLTPEQGSPRVVNADTDGVYRYVDLPAGTYRVLAEKAGFVPQLADPRRAYE